MAVTPGRRMEASSTAKNTFNPIRSIVDRGKVVPNATKAVISLALGDPTVFGNLNTDDAVVAAVQRALVGMRANGYGPVVGTDSARQAIADRYQRRFRVNYTMNDIVIASGCSGALDLAISVLCSPGQSAILLPSPGFTLYATLATSKSIAPIAYPLDPHRNWEIQLDKVEEALRGNDAIRAWIINNPSNPCGSVYSREHLEACLALASKYGVTVIADEIYEDMVFANHEYIPLAQISQESTITAHKVPILTCSGLAKRFLVPGWRFGWIAVHQPDHAAALDMTSIRKGLFDLSSLIIGANTLIQAALPDIFANTPEAFFTETNAYLLANATIVADALGAINGLHVIQPQGTLYMLVGIDMAQFVGFNTDIEFGERLLAEQSVAVLPGTIFGIPGYFRIVFSAPPEKIKEACERIGDFFRSHRVAAE